MSGGQGLVARRAALALLGGVFEDRRMLADLVAAEDGPLAPIEPSERARATSLATGVLRHWSRLDAVLAPNLRKRPPVYVHNALRLCAYEVLVDGAAPHGAVDSAVSLVGMHKRHRNLKGLTNAVARVVATEGQERFAGAPDPALPPWIRGPVSKRFGADAARGIARAVASDPPVDLTPKSPGDADALAARLGGVALPTGSVRLARPGQISALAGYDAGDWWVQDAAAALPVRTLSGLAGARVIDLCAAPGGKTMQLAAAGAKVTALDISDQRLERLRENLGRTGLGADLVAADALEWAPETPPDIVVLDAPCSATGTLRRHPDLPHVRDNPDLRPLLALQADLIDRALGWLAPGGRLLYCTCSLLPAEGEAQAEKALSRHDALEIVTRCPDGASPDWLSAEGHLRLRPDFWPDLGGMDGFFATVFQKS